MKKNIIKNKNKGFTLVELLAVIVVLAIILLIAIPNVTRLIEKSKEGSFEKTALLAYDAIKIHTTQTNFTTGNIADLPTLDTSEELEGTWSIDDDGVILVCNMANGKYYISGCSEMEDIVVLKGELVVGGGAEAEPTYIHNDTVGGTLEGDGEVGTPFLIQSIEDFVTFENNVNSGTSYNGKYVELDCDLSFSNIASYTAGTVDTALTTGAGWEPIDGFEGNFNGNDNVLDGLYINRPTELYVGFFGELSSWGIGNTVSNLGLTNVNITADKYAAALAGESYAIIDGVYSTGTVVTVGNWIAAGLIGRQQENVSNSYSSVDVSGNGGDILGGLIGQYDGDDQYTIQNSYATGDISGTFGYVGGLIGHSMNATVEKCYATGNVTGQMLTGGLIGATEGSNLVENTYATGNVTGTTKVGGLLGGGTAVNTSYAIGNINGDSLLGGLVGSAFGSLNNCFSTGDVTSSTSDEVGPHRGQQLFTAGTNNYYRDTVVVTNGTNTVGIPAVLSNFKAETWYAAALGSGMNNTWSSTIWDIVDGSFPTLK